MSNYKIGDLFLKNINSFGILYTINFYQIVDILEDDYIINWIEFIKEKVIPSSDENSCKYTIRYSPKEFNVIDKNNANRYFRYNITGEIDFQDILKIKDFYNSELAYKIIHKKFQTVYEKCI